MRSKYGCRLIISHGLVIYGCCILASIFGLVSVTEGVVNVSFESLESIADENDEVHNIDISLDQATNSVVEVGYTVYAISADTDDYTPVTGTVTFISLETHTNISINILQDGINERTASYSNECFRVALSASCEEVGVGSPSNHIVWISDDDIVVAFKNRVSSGPEGSTNLDIVVALDRPPGTGSYIEVNYKVTDITAGSEDFSLSDGSVIFTTNTEVRIIVTNLLDGIADSDGRGRNESYRLDLTNAIMEGSATGSIVHIHGTNNVHYSWILETDHTPTNYYVDLTGDNTNTGSYSSPFASIQYAVGLALPGDTIIIRDGIYREKIIFTGICGYVTSEVTNYVTIMAFTNESPVVCGSSVENGWVWHSGNIYKLTNWSDNSQQIFVDGYSLERLAWPNEIFEGTYSNWYLHPYRNATFEEMEAGLYTNVFFYDSDTATLYLSWLSGDPSGHTVEVSRFNRIMGPEVANSWPDYIKIQGITFQHTSSLSASNAFGLASVALGRGCLVENCQFIYGDSYGLSLGDNSRAIACNISHNGKAGFGFSGTNGLVFSCMISSNNTRHFNPAWDGGGMKSFDGYGTIENCIIAYNNGPGLWFDTCMDGDPLIIMNNDIHHNNLVIPKAGAFIIHLEASRNAMVCNNLLYYNAGADIGVASSYDCNILNNTIVGNSGTNFGASKVVKFSQAFRYQNVDLDDIEYLNNLIYENDTTYFMAITADDPAFVGTILCDYNCYNGNVNSEPRFGACYNIPYTNISDWVAGTGHDANSLTLEPQLMAGLFLQRISSPLNDGGSNLAEVVDDYRYRERTNDYDIGAYEYQYIDADDDGMNDIWEDEVGLLVTTNDSGGDIDGDGYTNKEEYDRGTDPEDDTSAGGTIYVDVEAPGSDSYPGFSRYVVQIGSECDGPKETINDGLNVANHAEDTLRIYGGLYVETNTIDITRSPACIFIESGETVVLD